jgi:myosin heavy subunit
MARLEQRLQQLEQQNRQLKQEAQTSPAPQTDSKAGDESEDSEQDALRARIAMYNSTLQMAKAEKCEELQAHAEQQLQILHRKLHDCKPAPSQHARVSRMLHAARQQRDQAVTNLATLRGKLADMQAKVQDETEVLQAREAEVAELEREFQRTASAAVPDASPSQTGTDALEAITKAAGDDAELQTLVASPAFVRLMALVAESLKCLKQPEQPQAPAPPDDAEVSVPVETEGMQVDDDFMAQVTEAAKSGCKQTLKGGPERGSAKRTLRG